MDKSHYSEFMGMMLAKADAYRGCTEGCPFQNRGSEDATFVTLVDSQIHRICNQGNGGSLLCERIKAAYLFLYSKEAEQPEPIVDDGIIRRVNVDD